MVFIYVGWDELEPKPGSYAFKKWESSAWESPLARGKHVVFRVYLDWPGKRSAVPKWLIESGIKMTHYTESGGGYSPDYNDARTIAALEKLILALGQKYDKDPRIAFVQFGVLGFWGEWHTYPRTELFASNQTERRILDLAQKAFPHKQIMNRYPTGYAGTQKRFGFFDDMFPYDTDGESNWMFLPKLRASHRMDAWKTVPFGGEMSPGNAKTLMSSEFGQTLSRAQAAHMTWIGPYCPALEAQLDSTAKKNSEELVRHMGYEYRLTKVSLPFTVPQGHSIEVNIEAVNQGVAPFYYNWPVELSLIDASGKIAQKWELAADIRTWLPGPFSVASKNIIRVRPGLYKVALGIRDPWTNAPAISFANDLPKVHLWTVLADLTVK